MLNTPRMPPHPVLTCLLDRIGETTAQLCSEADPQKTGTIARGKGKRGRPAAAKKAAPAKKRKTDPTKEAKQPAAEPVEEEMSENGNVNGKKPIIQFEAGWKELEGGINKLKQILEGEDVQFTALEFMELYTVCYDMCTQKPPNDYSKELYGKYKESFSIYIMEKVLPALKGHRDEYLLQELLKRWENHKIMVRWMVRFFNYLDRYFVNRNQKPTLKKLGLLVFRDEVYIPMKERAKDAILMLVQREREGYAIDRTLLKNNLGIFIEVSGEDNMCYKEDFETFLFLETADFYKRQAATWIQEDSCPDFMKKAEECLKQEEERVDNYLHADSKKGLLAEVEREVLANYEAQVLEKENSGCAALLRDNKKDDLGRMYRLFSRIVKGLDPVAEAFRKHVEGEGMALVKEVTEAAAQKKDEKGRSKDTSGANEQHYVSSLIALHDNYYNYVTTCFSNSSMFHKALKDAFESFCNKSVAGNSSAEMMATFCNNMLRKGGLDKMNEDEVDSQLEKVVKLLAYISDKDLFNEFYRKKLGRRLLNDTNSHDEAERSILSKLKQQCGTQFTSKMEGMVNDLQLAKEKQNIFEDWRKAKNKSLPCDLHVNVLTIGFWPIYKCHCPNQLNTSVMKPYSTMQAIDLALPQEMIDCIDAFKEHYEETSKHRKLTWIHTLGSITLKTAFKNRPELTMTPIQAVVLMLFNSQDALSYPEIKEQTSMNDDDLTRSLHSLSCAKYKLLIKDPKSNRINKTDKFVFNSEFTDKAKRIKVPLPPQDERKKVQEDVEVDRKHAVDAAIVRTMKSRKQLAHQQLIMEVVAQLQRMFQPDFRLIKRRIEDLIQREYLARDLDNQNLYKYVA